MADNPSDRPYSKTQSENVTQRGSSRYAKAIPIVTQENMRHEVLPLASARAATRLAQERIRGSVNKANARQRYLQLLKEEFVKAKQEYQNVK